MSPANVISDIARPAVREEAVPRSSAEGRSRLVNRPGFRILLAVFLTILSAGVLAGFVLMNSQGNAVQKKERAVPVYVATAIFKMLAEAPEDRFQSATELKAKLEHCTRF